MNESVDPDQTHLDQHILFQKQVKNFEKKIKELSLIRGQQYFYIVLVLKDE